MIVGRRRTAASGLAALALTVLLTGCASAGQENALAEGGDASPTPAAESSPAAAPSPDEKPSETPAETPVEPAPSADDQPTAQTGTSGRRTLRDRLLSADQVPTISQGFTWTPGATRSKEGARPFGTCHKFAMTSIGASKVAVRSFEPSAEGRTASTLVAGFADEMTAKRAFDVLKSWRGQCGEELKRHDRLDVGDFEAVPDAGGTGGWYLLVYGPAGDNPDQSYYDAQGLVRVGSRIAVVQLRLVGQDYNFDAGNEPMVDAVQAAAANLG